MSEQVRLRDVEPADLEVLFVQQHDPEALRRSRFPPRERDVFMAHWTTNVLGNPTGFVQAVTVDGELAGNVLAWWDEGCRSLGYWLGRRYWGRGIGSRAVALFLEEEKARPLYADSFVGNTASVRLLEGLGFRRTDTVWYGGFEHVRLVLDEPRGGSGVGVS
ncbi:GNAT family protein [Streptomyces sp. SID3212]|uniref:GNAT family N-acetyltransferase n=1 Tax=Streptomyces sp. SID3212 TaxID=2690259 RepID=UPI00192563CB|nr:GNAT family protein [Streptomyces sp. SID3212]